MRNRYPLFSFTAIGLCLNLLAQAAGSNLGKEQRRGPRDLLPMPAVDWPAASLLVARTTDTSVDINILPRANLRGTICYRKSGTGDLQRSAPVDLTSGLPCVVHLAPLASDSLYDYWLDCVTNGTSPQYAFHTQRAPGSAFQFIVQGDSHPERSHQHTPALYEQALRRIARERPDFFITLGDDFSVDALRAITPMAVDDLYRMQREYLGLVGAAAPLFLVNGNHEQAARCNLDGTPDNVAVWAQNSREKYFSQPAPYGIYSGDREPVDHIGLLRDYYAWTWGDALFVVIDPYWHSRKAVDNVLGGREKNRDEWNPTLGDVQYHWLEQTLQTSRASFKFVFTHHVLGRGRGGIECAASGEWGGGHRDGADVFSHMRPGWAMPIHQLMVKNGVTLFFQGHDHLFCRQELDGVVYQTCPLPAGPADSRENFEAYRSGVSLPGAGFLRVSVKPACVQVEFVRNLLQQDAAQGKDGEVADTYQIGKAASRIHPTTSRINPASSPIALDPASARKPGERFRFAIQADSHLDNNTNTNLYLQTLKNIAGTKADFLVDLGDTFMTGKLPSREAAEAQYRTQRNLLDTLALPILLVLGNHDGEEQKRPQDRGPGSRAEWSLAQRKKYFPNPEPDGFFTGNPDGKQDYFSWTWGDALFVVLSPYWYSGSLRGGRDPWDFTLGDAQYAWLKKTLETSKANFKFVFIHQLTGSIDAASRGGAEAAKRHEWGDTSPDFKRYRPDWPMNIHQLLCETHVAIVFHGHDHFYAREALDGVIYQLVPQPGARNNRSIFADEYGYAHGVFHPSSGFLSVDVSATTAIVSYIRSATSDEERSGIKNLSVTHTYQVGLR